MLDPARILAILEAARRGAPRFGSEAHGFRLAPPLAEERLQEIEATLGAPLPEDYRAFLATVGAHGAGPGYGLVNLDHPAQWDGPARDPFIAPETCVLTTVDGERIEGHSNFTPHREGMVLLADHGCCKLSLLVVHGDDAGAVYADLATLGKGLQRTHASFTDWYGAWLEDVAAGRESAFLGDPPLCATPDALSNYFRSWAEQAKGDPSAQLSPGDVREALGGIGAGGITSGTGEDRFFAEQAVRVCASCRGLLDNLIRQGLDPAAVGAGEAPRPEREGPAPSEPEAVPGCPIARLSDYVAFLREVQGGDMVGALARRGLAMNDYGAVAMAWSQAMMRDPQLMAAYAAKMGG